MALLDEQGRGAGAIDASGHGCYDETRHGAEV
jgi:hypothetical protein